MMDTATKPTPNKTQDSNGQSDVLGASVLVVDDDPSIHFMTKSILEKFGYAYHGAQSAFEAIELMHHIQPELIMSDIFMPMIDGLEFCVCIKADERWSDIPFVFFTADSEPELLASAFEAGAVDFLTKPLRAFEIASRVQHHIQKYRQLRADNELILSLDSKNQSMTKFLGVASHDLRNPLISIRGLANYLKSDSFGNLNDNQMELVNAILQSSESMLDLVENLLEVAQFKRKFDQVSKKKQEDLETLLKLARTLHSGYAGQKQISLNLELPEETVLATIDRKLITRLVDNLISNAIKFSPPETEVLVKLEVEDENISISVEDEGPGIPEEEFQLLFKEFSKTSNSPTAGESSNGLGLYVCKQIAEAHDGTIQVQNRPKKGAAFIVTLPRDDPHET